jgi:hypothetical protein
MDTHSFATLLGVGATTVNPYLALIACIKDIVRNYLVSSVLMTVLKGILIQLMLVFLK